MISRIAPLIYLLILSSCVTQRNTIEEQPTPIDTVSDNAGLHDKSSKKMKLKRESVENNYIILSDEANTTLPAVSNTRTASPVSPRKIAKREVNKTPLPAEKPKMQASSNRSEKFSFKPEVAGNILYESPKFIVHEIAEYDASGEPLPFCQGRGYRSDNKTPIYITTQFAISLNSDVTESLTRAWLWNVLRPKLFEISQNICGEIGSVWAKMYILGVGLESTADSHYRLVNVFSHKYPNVFFKDGFNHRLDGSKPRYDGDIGRLANAYFFNLDHFQTLSPEDELYADQQFSLTAHCNMNQFVNEGRCRENTEYKNFNPLMGTKRDNISTDSRDRSDNYEIVDQSITFIDYLYKRVKFGKDGDAEFEINGVPTRDPSAVVENIYTMLINDETTNSLYPCSNGSIAWWCVSPVSKSQQNEYIRKYKDTGEPSRREMYDAFVAVYRGSDGKKAIIGNYAAGGIRKINCDSISDSVFSCTYRVTWAIDCQLPSNRLACDLEKIAGHKKRTGIFRKVNDTWTLEWPDFVE